jgi:hypothetical protein
MLVGRSGSALALSLREGKRSATPSAPLALSPATGDARRTHRPTHQWPARLRQSVGRSGRDQAAQGAQRHTHRQSRRRSPACLQLRARRGDALAPTHAACSPGVARSIDRGVQPTWNDARRTVMTSDAHTRADQRARHAATPALRQAWLAQSQEDGDQPACCSVSHGHIVSVRLACVRTRQSTRTGCPRARRNASLRQQERRRRGRAARGNRTRQGSNVSHAFTRRVPRHLQCLSLLVRDGLLLTPAKPLPWRASVGIASSYGRRVETQDPNDVVGAVADGVSVEPLHPAPNVVGARRRRWRCAKRDELHGVKQAQHRHEAKVVEGAAARHGAPLQRVRCVVDSNWNEARVARASRTVSEGTPRPSWRVK